MKRLGSKILFGAVVLTIGFVCLLMASKKTEAQDAAADFPPQVPPAMVVPYLDLACHTVEGGETPVDRLQLGHLNPVFRDMGITDEIAYLGKLEQLCAPVAKNRQIPPWPVRKLLRWMDLACYQAKSEEPHQRLIRLDHLNPVLREMGLPTVQAIMTRLEQVCLPVAKNNVVPPDDVLRFIQHVDVACYRIDPLVDTPSFPLHLTHLNPVLRELGIKEQDIRALFPEQLCVPVMKNDRKPPQPVLDLVQWIDFMKYEAVSASDISPVKLRLRHLNPLFRDYNPFTIAFYDIDQIALPTAKNGVFPAD